MRFDLEEVEHFPKELLPGKLYHSAEFQTSRHLCACGCGDVIKLPIDHLHHRISLGDHGPTLRPSVGNWNICDAHYFITDGVVEWLPRWSAAQISGGRRIEDEKREEYFNSRNSFFRQLTRGVAFLFSRGWSSLRNWWRK